MSLLLLVLAALDWGSMYGVLAAGNGVENYYSLLEVQPNASKSEIKKAFRNLSKKYHPDKNPGDEQAADHFKKINRASEVLTDDNLRQIFDAAGEDGLERFER